MTTCKNSIILEIKKPLVILCGMLYAHLSLCNAKYHMYNLNIGRWCVMVNSLVDDYAKFSS